MSTTGSIALLIDNDPKLLDYALYLANECLSGVQDRTAYLNLADSLRVWIELGIENYGEQINYSITKEEFFFYLFQQLVENITEGEWLDLAHHYGRKYLELNQYSYKENWAVPNPLL